MKPRTTLAALAALATLSAAATPQLAEACGYRRPEPRVMQLTTHRIKPSDTSLGGTRMFAHTGVAPAARRAFRLLAPGTYDAARIAERTPLPAAFVMTLVGRDGTRIVESRHSAVLADLDFRGGEVNALELTHAVPGAFTIAIEGRHPQARWTELPAAKLAPAAATRWVSALGVAPHDVYVRRIPGTTLELVSTQPHGTFQPVTFLRDGDRNLGRHDGRALGIVTNAGVRELVMVRGGATWTVYLGTEARA